MKKYILLSLLIVLCFTVRAIDTKTWYFPNNTGALARDIHILLTGTGGSFDYNYPTINPAVHVNSNQLNLDFDPGIPNGSGIGIKFTTDPGPLGIDSWYWTDVDHNQIGPTYHQNDVQVSGESNRGIRSLHFSPTGNGHFNIIAELAVENASYDGKDLSSDVTFYVNNSPVQTVQYSLLVAAGTSTCTDKYTQLNVPPYTVIHSCVGDNCPTWLGWDQYCIPGDWIKWCHCQALRFFTINRPLNFGDLVTVQIMPSTGSTPEMYTADDQRSATFSASDIPTLSQWGLINLALLLLSTGVVALKRRQVKVVVAGAEIQESIRLPLFDAGLYFKVLAVILLVALTGLASSFLIFGALTFTDMAGTMSSALLVAFLVQLIIPAARK